MMEAIKRFFAAPEFEDPAKTLTASLLNFITIAYFIVLVLVFTLAVLSSDAIAGAIQGTLVVLTPFFVILIVTQMLMRQGKVRAASVFFAVAHWLSITLQMFLSGGVASAGLSNYILSILIFGLLLGNRYAVFSAVASLIAAVTALVFENLDLLPAPLIPNDPIGNLLTFIVLSLLGTAFLYLFLQRLKDLNRQREAARKEIERTQADLERRVIEATQVLMLAAQVGQRVALLHDPETMLKQAVALIRDRFDLYYTQVYLVDAAGRSLVLQAGTGEIGQRLLQKGHRLPVDLASINGAAAVERQAVIVEDTETSAIHRPNPLLPDTRSEIAVPLIAGERVLGVLDLQSSRPGDLTREKLPAFEVLAGELAVAIVNAELRVELEQARNAVEQQVRRLERMNWQDFLDAIRERERIAYVYEDGVVKPLDQLIPEDGDNVLNIPIEISGEPIGTLQFEGERPWTAEEQAAARMVARQAAQQIENLRLLAQAERYRAEAEDAIRRLTREGWETYLERNPLENIGFIYQNYQVEPLDAETTDHSESRYTSAIQVSGETIGDISIEQGTVSPEDQELLAAIGEQLSAHLENLRLTAETERRIAELDVINQISAILAQEPELDIALEKVLAQVARAFNVDSAYIALYDADRQLIDVRATLYRGRKAARRPAIPLGSGIISYIITNRKVVFINEDTDRRLRELGAIPIDEAKGAPMTQSYIGLPMVVGDQVVGVLNINDPYQSGRFTEADVNLLSTIAANTAVAIQNARSFQDAQQRARREQALRQITSAVTASTDPVAIMRAAVQEIGSILGRRTVIRMAAPNPKDENPTP